MSDAPDETIQSAHGEMAFQTTKGQFGNSFDVSIPCQLRFTEEPSQDTDRFHDLLDERGFSPATPNPAKIDRDVVYYDGEVITSEDYKRIQVLVFRGDTVRIYPGEQEPDVSELGDLVDAIEEGFDAPLVHEPIKENADVGREESDE